MKAFDRICEVQSDKATVEITSRFDGVIRAVHHSEGSIVKVISIHVVVLTLLMTITPHCHLFVLLLKGGCRLG